MLSTWRVRLAKLAVPTLPLALIVALAPSGAAEETGCYAVAGNIVQNCGFESGYASPWTITVNGGYTYVADQSASGLPAHTGDHFVVSHSSPGSVVEQTLATTAGVTYEVAFYLSGGDYWESNFALNVDPDASGPAEAVTLLNRGSLPSVPLPDYTLLTAQFVALGNAATLDFVLVLLPNYWFLDDVSVVPLTSAQTITVTTPAPATAAYGESFDVAATASSELPVEITTTGGCSVVGSTVTMTSGTTDCDVHYNQAGNGSYSPAPEVTDTVAAQKASQSISFGTLADRPLDQSPVTVVATATSQLAVQFATTTPAVCTAGGDNGATISLASAGACTVTADQAGDANYAAAAQVVQTFAVTPPKIDQTITVTAPPPTSAAIGGSFTVSAVATSRLPVTIAVSGPCTVLRRTVTVTGATGDCVVTFSQPGNATYDAAPDVVYTVATHKVHQTISFRTLADRRLSQSPLTLKATATSKLTVSFASTTPAVCTVDGTTLRLVTPGRCTVQADQAGNDTYDAAPSVTRSFTVKP